MTKQLYQMSTKELIELERNGGENGHTSDLCTELACRLEQALVYLTSCIGQCEDYSENDFVFDRTNKEYYPIEELKEFAGVSK